MFAPVVRPRTLPRLWMIAPAARNATPAVTASMMRIGSAVVLWIVADHRVMQLERDQREQRGGERDQDMRAQSGRLVAQLAVEADRPRRRARRRAGAGTPPTEGCASTSRETNQRSACAGPVALRTTSRPIARFPIASAGTCRYPCVADRELRMDYRRPAPTSSRCSRARCWRRPARAARRRTILSKRCAKRSDRRTSRSTHPAAKRHPDSEALRNYPLYPYLQAARIRRALADAGEELGSVDQRAQTFITYYENEPVGRNLRRVWLTSLAERGQWAARSWISTATISQTMRSMPELHGAHRARSHDRSRAAHRATLADSAQPAGLRARVRLAARAERADARAHRAARAPWR